MPIPTRRAQARRDRVDASPRWPPATPGSRACTSRIRCATLGSAPTRGRLVLAVRPIQVLPPWQDLNITGGWTPVRSIRVRRRRATRQRDRSAVVRQRRVSARRRRRTTRAIRWRCSPRAIGRTADDAVECPAAIGIGAAELGFRAASRASRRRISICVPFHGTTRRSIARATPPRSRRSPRKVAADWSARVERVTFRLPAAARQFHDTIRATQAYILINHDGKGFQPGSRTYERSWMRDGSMTSAAMLEFGHDELVKRFIDWYAPYQFPIRQGAVRRRSPRGRSRARARFARAAHLADRQLPPLHEATTSWSAGTSRA